MHERAEPRAARTIVHAPQLDDRDVGGLGEDGVDPGLRRVGRPRGRGLHAQRRTLRRGHDFGPAIAPPLVVRHPLVGAKEVAGLDDQIVAPETEWRRGAKMSALGSHQVTVWVLGAGCWVLGAGC